MLAAAAGLETPTFWDVDMMNLMPAEMEGNVAQWQGWTDFYRYQAL